MKKQLITLSLALAGIVACQKEKDIIDPPVAPLPGGVTLVKDTSYPDQTVTTPKNQVLLASYSIRIGRTEECDLDEVLVFVSGTPTFPVSTAMRNIRLVIKQGTSVVFDRTKSGVGSVNQFALALNNVRTNTVYSVEIFADVVDATLSTTLSIESELLYYTPQQGETQTGRIAGQRTTIAKAVLTTSIASTTPQRQKVHGNQTVRTLDLFLHPQGEVASVSSIKVQVPNATVIEQVIITDGTATLGEGSVAGTTVSIPVSIAFSDTTSKKISIFLKLKPIANESQSGINIRPTVTQVTYATRGGETRVSDVSRTGNDMFVYKSLPTFGYGSYGNVITNNQFQEISVISVSASASGSIGLKQLTYEYKLQDNGISDSTLRGDSLMLFVDGVAQSNVVFTNASGQQITSLPESGTKFSWTVTSGIGQEINIPQNTSKTFVVKAVRRGFSASDGDLMWTKLIGDTEVFPYEYRYVNQGPSGYSAKLFSMNASHSAAKFANIIWSDHSSPSSSSAFGASSADHYNSEGIFIPNTMQTFYRR